MSSVVKQICYLCIAGVLIFAPAGFAQYSMTLTGVGDGTSMGGAYVGPYNGTISQNGQQIYSGYVICDDYNTDSTLDTPWYATETNAGSLNGTEKFTGPTAQQNYDAVAWLANNLLYGTTVEGKNTVPNVTDPTEQIDYSYAIWDIFDGRSDGGAPVLSLITAAFAAVNNTKQPYVASNVEVFTPSSQNPKGKNASQEFLVVNGPVVATPEPAAAALLGCDLLSVLGIVYLLRRYRIRA
jgi:hypothetical protein